MNAAEIVQAMSSSAAEIAAYLLPKGKKSGQEWQAGSIAGEPGKSLSVRIGGSKHGVWQDFATGHGGDLLDLWCSVRGCSVSEAMREASGYLGLRSEAPKRPEKSFTRPKRAENVRHPKFGALEWLRGRGLTDQVIADMKIGERIDAGKTYAVFPYLRDGQLINAKWRNIGDKRDMRQESGAEPCLFGWHLIKPGERQVILTEGEIDAATLIQFGLPALSCNAGALNFQWIENDWERLLRFSDVVIAYDDDEAGRKGAAEVSRRLGIERCRLCTFPGHKDANEALMAGEDGEYFFESVRAARSIDPAELQSFADYMDRVKGLLYPSDGAEDGYPMTIGRESRDWLRFRAGELTVWSGINGHGKSLWLSQLAIQLALQGSRWCIWSGEMQPVLQAKRIVKQCSGLEKPSPQYIDAIGEWARSRLWVVSVIGSASLNKIVGIFAYANRRYGVDSFLIDSLMMLDVPEDGNGSMTAQKKAIHILADFAKRHNCHVHLVAHPRKPLNESTRTGKMDVAGSSKLTDGADNVLTVWSAKLDQEASDYDPEKPDGYVSIHKQRNGDVQERSLAVFLHRPSGQFCLTYWRRPIHLIEMEGAPCCDGYPE